MQRNVTKAHLSVRSNTGRRVNKKLVKLRTEMHRLCESMDATEEEFRDYTGAAQPVYLFERHDDIARRMKKVAKLGDKYHARLLKAEGTYRSRSTCAGGGVCDLSGRTNTDHTTPPPSPTGLATHVSSRACSPADTHPGEN
eukprot:404305-Rhodomonas_salina.3